MQEVEALRFSEHPPMKSTPFEGLKRFCWREIQQLGRGFCEESHSAAEAPANERESPCSSLTTPEIKPDHKFDRNRLQLRKARYIHTKFTSLKLERLCNAEHQIVRKYTICANINVHVTGE